MGNKEEVLPYLAKYAIPRTQSDQIEGWYSREKSMWMLDTDTGPHPAIECDSASLEMVTKKEMQRERDEDITLELLTKTDAQRERDD